MIIFLDIDRVLNQLQRWYIDENCVKVLSKICSYFNSRIILTSSWRKGYHHKPEKCSKQVQDLISKLSKYNLRISGVAEDFNNRTLEVENFVKNHNIKEYMILDDDSSLFDNTKNLYLVNSKTGLTDKDYKLITRKFKV